jgi:serine/threonine protein kinase
MKRGRLTERETSLVVRDIANGLNFLHSKGMSHRFGRKKNHDFFKTFFIIYIEI